MGMLDWLTSQQQPQSGIGGGMSDLFSNPLTFGALGALGAYADTLEPSRLPKSPVAGLLRGAAGFGQGYLNGQQATTLNSLKDVQLAQQASRLAMMQQYGLLPPGFKIPGAIGSMMGGGAQPAQTAPATGPAPMSGPAMPPGSLDPNAYQQAGAGSGAPGDTPASAGSAPPAAGPGLAGLPFSPDAVRGALAAELIAPGAGKSQLPGPTAVMQALRDANIDPRSPTGQAILANAAAKSAGLERQNVRQGGSVYNPVTGKVEFQNPVLGEGVQLDPSSGQAQTVPNFVGAAAPVRSMEEGIKAGARAAEHSMNARTDYTNQYGAPPPAAGGGFGFSPSLGTGQGQPTGPQAAAGQPVITPPAGAAPPGQMKGGDFTTERGTVVPTIMGNQTIGPGGEQSRLQLANSAKTEENWNSVRPTIEMARQRLQGLSDAFQQVETGSFTSNRADFANALRGLGATKAADAVMSGASAAAVQESLWFGMQDVLAQLKTINAGTGGRILNSEFNAFIEHGFSPNMQPGALRKAIVSQLGQTYQVQNMIDDYQGPARNRLGWRDANQYQSAYLTKNPIEGFVDYADKTVPQFKGMVAPQAGQNATAGGRTPMPGAVEGGYRFKGGNPADRNSWEKVQ